MASRALLASTRCGPERSGGWKTRKKNKEVYVPSIPSMDPPPSPPRLRKKRTWYWDGEGPTRRGIVAGLLGGGFLYWNVQRSRFPKMYQDKNGNLYVKTDGGNYLGVDFDEAGRMFLIDNKGNVYYDTGFVEGGIDVMSKDGEMYNMFRDKDGSVAKVRLGNRKDLATMETPEYGEITAFMDKNVPQALTKPNDSIEGEIPLPPVDAPPPVIDEGIFSPKR